MSVVVGTTTVAIVVSFPAVVPALEVPLISSFQLILQAILGIGSAAGTALALVACPLVWGRHVW